ncbi:FliH/SctL family protein [Lentisphaerota bacterium WC36G]|nr:hypothetical protein LJT99_01100 [Lentisphaerae bacterium WC36]
MPTFKIINSADSKSKIIVNEPNPWQLKYNQLQGQLPEIKANAFNEGFQQCKKDIEEKCQQQLLNEHQEVENFKNETIELCNSFYNKLQQQIKEEIVSLSLSIAEGIIEESLREKDDITKKTIEEMISNITDFKDAIIFVSADTHVYLMKNGLDYLPNNLSIKVDSRLKKGDCRLESPSGIIDATIATRFKVIKEKVTANLNNLTD